jgi:threonine/homoserine/homoserine lactone efflux protein
MSDWPPIPLAALVGFATALLFSSIPVGPINLTILNEGARRGFKWALLIGLGASAMEVIYCSIAFTGFSSFFVIPEVKAFMELFTCGFLLFLGMKFISAKTVNVPGKLDTASRKIETRLEKKMHPHSAFMTGFVRVMGNLGVLLVWIVAAGNFMAHDWVDDTFSAKAVCVAGVALGTNTWFLALSFGVSRGHGRFSEDTLVRLQRLSGVCLIVFSCFDGGHIVWQLAKHVARHRF